MVTEDDTRTGPPVNTVGDGEPQPTRGRRKPPVVDLLAVLVLLAMFPVVYSIGSILRQPYWLDEAWVALSMRAPASELPWVTASTPLGWTLLLHLFPAGGQAQRLLPLCFLAGAVVAGYALGRRLPWVTRAQAVIAGLAGAVAILLLPVEQVRHDLKQYTADAAVAVLLLVLVGWLESAWSRRRAALLGAVVVLATLFSHTTFFVGGAALGGLAIEALIRRAWRRLAELVGLGLATGVGAGCVYLFIDSTGRTPGMYVYWKANFPTAAGLPGYLHRTLHLMNPVLGLPWWLFLGLAALGVLTVARLGRPATALAALLLPVEAVVAGVGRLYPLLDLRTSNYLLVTAAGLAGIGLTGAGAWLGRLIFRRSPVRSAAVAAALLVVIFGGYAAANRHWLRYPIVTPAGAAPRMDTPPGNNTEDVRAQVRYIAAHRQPGDVILVGVSAQYGFGYYWSADRPRFQRSSRPLIGWQVAYPSAARILIVPGTTPTDVRGSVDAARRLAVGHRIWVVRSHQNPGELAAWQGVLAPLSYTRIPVGTEPLGLIDDSAVRP